MGIGYFGCICIVSRIRAFVTIRSKMASVPLTFASVQHMHVDSVYHARAGKVRDCNLQTQSKALEEICSMNVYTD